MGGHERKKNVMDRAWQYVMCMSAPMGLTAEVACGVSDAAAEETNLILNRPTADPMSAPTLGTRSSSRTVSWAERPEPVG